MYRYAIWLYGAGRWAIIRATSYEMARLTAIAIHGDDVAENVLF